MTIQEIYNAFEKIGCLSFTTINEHGEPESRIAHLRAYDENGLYFMTMFTKSFYKQLTEGKKISLCGLRAKTEIEHNAEGFPIFDHGYSMRMTGDVMEVPMEEIKAKNNPLFDFCIKDQEKYPAMVVFCITKGYGDLYDYDFEKVNRDHKLERTYFSYNGAEIKLKGLEIDQDRCIQCGECTHQCSFSAVKEENGQYHIDPSRCDECGSCFGACIMQAIHYKSQG